MRLDPCAGSLPLVAKGSVAGRIKRRSEADARLSRFPVRVTLQAISRYERLDVFAKKLFRVNLLLDIKFVKRRLLSGRGDKHANPDTHDAAEALEKLSTTHRRIERHRLCSQWKPLVRGGWRMGSGQWGGKQLSGNGSAKPPAGRFAGTDSGHTSVPILTPKTSVFNS